MWVVFICQVYTCQESVCFKFNWNAFYGTFAHHSAQSWFPILLLTHYPCPHHTESAFYIIALYHGLCCHLISLSLCHVWEPTQWLSGEALWVILLLQVEKLRLIELWFGWRFQDVQCQMQDINLGLADGTAFTLSAHMQYKFWDFTATHPTPVSHFLSPDPLLYTCTHRDTGCVSILGPGSTLVYLSSALGPKKFRN